MRLLICLGNFKTSGCLVGRPTCAPATTRLTPQLVGTSTITCSLVPTEANLLLKKVLVTSLGFFGASVMIGARGITPPLPPSLRLCYSLLFLLYRNIMTFDALLTNLRHASTNWWKANKNKNIVKFSWSFVGILMYTILLNKLRFDQISCSGRSGTR